MTERPRLLHLEYDGEVIAHLTQRREGEPIRLRHTELALDRWTERLPVISCSLPVSRREQDATAYLDGLLPEGDARRVMAERRDLRSSDTWGLLAAHGRDVAGALVLRDPEREPTAREPSLVPYASMAQLAADVVALPEQPLGARDDSELSLAGVQDKLLLRADPTARTGWARPAGGAPSTHILKPDPLAHPGVVVREGEALGLANRVGLTTIEPQVLDIDGRPCLVVGRYDRRTAADGVVRRLHQEDLLQATGVHPAARRGRAKYQHDDGEGFRAAATLLLERAQDPMGQLHQLVGAMVFTVLVGNSDAHAKNLSFLLDPPGTVRLAPLYDPVPTMLFPGLRVRCAMWIGGVHASLEQVDRAALVREVAGRHAWKVPAGQASDWVDEWVARIVAATEANPTDEYVRQRAQRL